MQNLPQNHDEPNADLDAATVSGLSVRTDLRAGLAWDDLDDQAKSLWGQISSAVSNAVSNATDTTTSA
jgi:hypothetical protein